MENETTPQPADHWQKIKPWILAGILPMAAVVIVGFTVYFWQKMKIEQLEKNYQSQIESFQAKLGPMQPQETPGNDYQNPISAQNDNAQNDAEASYMALKKISVDWQKDSVETREGCNEGYRCFQVGKIAGDNPAYKGKVFYLEASETMGGYDMRHYVIEKNSGGSDRKLYAEPEGYPEDSVEIAGITDIPEEISFPDTKYKLKKHYLPSQFYSDLKTDKKLFSDKKLGDLYLTENGCIVAELPDRTAIAYDLVLPFIEEEERIPDIIFNSGEKNKEEYEYLEHTCGGVCTQLSQADGYLKPDDNIEVMGKTSNGESIYRFKDPNNQKLKDLYDDESTMAYYNDDFEGQEKNKYSYDEFVKSNPYLFWKDPLGRWISFLNSKFSAAAEMCKPVIYLYPEKSVDLGLKLDVDGFLTLTDPPYKNGWRVNASPDGKIRNLDTGEYHDSLLWEGIGLNYPEQKEGWIVKRENLDAFFKEKLAMLGLNEKETGDFKEYWLARLNEKPFYQISFLSRRQFERLASVKFNPVSPDVFIRVMMTAKGLDNYIDIPEQVLPKTPKRSGFTAVEWGGALLK